MGEGQERSAADAIDRRRFLAAAAVAAGTGFETRAAAAAEGERMADRFDFDAVVVGGGPAGLSAALVLGRARRRVLVCDAGEGRNAPAEGVHGFLTQDGTPPAELRRVGREQLARYGVAFREGRVSAARKVEGGFEVTPDGGEAVRARTLILATGLADVLPEVPGLKEVWGRGVFHCPFCHGWEVRDRPWAFIAPPEGVVESATMFLGWTKGLTLLTDGRAGYAPALRAWLAAQGVKVEDDRVERVEGAEGRLTAVVLAGGRRLTPAALFVRTTLKPRSGLAESLGCALVAEGPKAGMVRTGPMGATDVPGLFVVGDASDGGVPTVASAVAEGATAAAFATRALLSEDAGAVAPPPK